MVPGEGIEPSVEDPKSSALPLGHPGSGTNNTSAEVLPLRECDLQPAQAFGIGMKATLLSALLLLTAACGAYSFPGSPQPQTGAVSGRVLLVPYGPVQRVGDTCAGRPGAGLEIDFVDPKAVHSTVTDQSGNYSIQLTPATYQVQFKSYMRILSGPKSVTVISDSLVTANYVLDSGIRLPAPQQ